MLNFDKLPPQAMIAVGVVLVLLGGSFVWKAYQAMIKGRLRYWDGFLPFTLISPFTLHVPASKNSLIKTTEGLWVHILMGPIFMFCAILCICAGFDLVDLPGTQTLNLILNGGKIGNDQVTFDAHSGYHFPILNKAKPVFYKLFNGQMGVKNGDKLYQDNQGSYNDAASK